jgi:hypothetical protein
MALTFRWARLLPMMARLACFSARFVARICDLMPATEASAESMADSK